MSSQSSKWPASQHCRDCQQVSPHSQSSQQILLPWSLQMWLRSCGVLLSHYPIPTWDRATLLGTQEACWLQQLVQD